MGLRVYVARSGWRETPITADEWHDAVVTLPELEVHHVHGGGPVRAMLRGSQRRGLAWNDGYISAHHANARLVAVLFVLADRLGARVYSAHRRPYLDVADWEQRTQRYRRYPGEKGRVRRGVLASGGEAMRSTAQATALWGPFIVLLVVLVIGASWAFQ
ncbi:hypothetical protein HLB44_27975 [Aquincola sp. S2]|uniref:Uncharacterized protein n=1 Tax=Pseudaquabacterium terrae TaxID=2732868 RepID=A0ABX2EQ96_9BURK|nr:hypothetical protein [Aquabacterium terrae]NRF70849.1 hypothetical protein [Aquabacterium terrae]